MDEHQLLLLHAVQHKAFELHLHFQDRLEETRRPLTRDEQIQAARVQVLLDQAIEIAEDDMPPTRDHDYSEPTVDGVLWMLRWFIAPGSDHSFANDQFNVTALLMMTPAQRARLKELISGLMASIDRADL
jgi:hypothetical protein